MYTSKLQISTKSKQILERKLSEFLVAHKKIYWKGLKRTVSLAKLPDTILKRRESATLRLQRFFVAVDILQNSIEYTVREQKGCLEYKIIGFDKDGKKVSVHLREELSIKKDKVLFFVSCY